jgi:hypothetical protein
MKIDGWDHAQLRLVSRAIMLALVGDGDVEVGLREGAAQKG